MPSMKRGDTKPDLTINCTDDGTPVDLTQATNIRVIGVRDGVEVFDDNAVVGDDQGVITRTWAVGDTDTVGRILLEVEVTWPGGGVQTFPPDTYLALDIVQDLG